MFNRLLDMIPALFALQTSKELKYSLHSSLSWQLALADYVGQIDRHCSDLPIL